MSRQVRRPLKDGFSGREQGLQGRRQPARAARCEPSSFVRRCGRLASESALSPERERGGREDCLLRIGRAGAAPRSCEGVSRTPSSRGATPVNTEGTLKPARACGGRALYVVSRGARIASGARRCPAPSCGAGAVRQSLCLQTTCLLVSYRPLANIERRRPISPHSHAGRKLRRTGCVLGPAKSLGSQSDIAASAA